MKKIEREPIEKPFVENTVMNKLFIGQRHTGYEIIPRSGYKLHDGRLDRPGEDGEKIPGYRESSVTVGRDYDFECGGKHGFYTVLIYI